MPGYKRKRSYKRRLKKKKLKEQEEKINATLRALDGNKSPIDRFLEDYPVNLSQAVADLQKILNDSRQAYIDIETTFRRDPWTRKLNSQKQEPLSS